MVWLVLVEEYKKRKKTKDEICENMMIDILVKDAWEIDVLDAVTVSSASWSTAAVWDDQITKNDLILNSTPENRL